MKTKTIGAAALAVGMILGSSFAMAQGGGGAAGSDTTKSGDGGAIKGGGGSLTSDTGGPTSKDAQPGTGSDDNPQKAGKTR